MRPPAVPVDSASASSLEPVDIPRYVRGFRERWWLFLLVFVLGGGGIVAGILAQRPTYRAESEIKILRQPESFTEFRPLQDQTLRTAEDINTVIETFGSELFIHRVAARVRRENLDRFLAPYWQPGSGEEQPRLEKILLRHRDIVPARASLFAAISYTHPRPDVAAEVANFFVAEITAFESENQADAARRAVRELQAQAETQRRRMEKLEQELVDFKVSSDSISFDRRSDIDGQELLFLTNALSQDERELDAARTRVAMVEQNEVAGRPAWEVPFITESPRVSQLLLTVSNRRAEVERLASTFRDPHPKMIEARTGLAAAETEFTHLVDAEVRGVRSRLNEAEANHTSSAAKLEAKKKSIIALHRLQAVYDSMSNDLATTREVYSHLQQRVHESEAQARSGGMNVQVIYEAVPPVRAYWPNPMVATGLGIAGGGGLAFVVVLLALLVDPKVRTRHDVQRELAPNVLATVERLSGGVMPAQERALQALETPSTCETLCALAASLRLTPHQEHARVLLVASTVAGEGKSFLASALGASFHRLGERVVVVSADLRAPAPDGDPVDARALRDLALDATDGFEPFLVSPHRAGPDRIHAGGRHENPYRLFNSPGFARLLNFLRQRYDRILIDTPPLAHFGDALALAPHADLALFVIRYNHVSIRLTQRTLQSLRDSALPVAGVVINGVRTPDLRMYYAGYYKEATSAAPARGRAVQTTDAVR